MSKGIKFLSLSALLFLIAASSAFAIVRIPAIPSLLSYLARPQLIRYYFSEPALRDLMNLIAADQIQSFLILWDTKDGILLSKKLFREINMDGKKRYGYLPNIKKIAFQTGTQDLQRKFEAPDTPRLRSILKRLNTQFIKESTFDANGFRRVESGAPDNCSQTILFLGDSFTEGLWVSDAETFVSLYARHINQNSLSPQCVINSGTNGYGTFEEYYIARTYFPKFRYKTIFLIHYPNDVNIDTFGVMNGTRLNSQLEWTEHLNILKDLTDFSKKNSIRLILVSIPPKDQLLMPGTRRNYQEILARFASAEGIEYYDPFEIFQREGHDRIYLDWDPHFNTSGHEIFAGFLWDKTHGDKIAK